MNLGMILNAPYPADVRIKKEADALIKAGYIVHLLCLKQPKEKAEEVFENIHVTRIKAGESKYSLAFWDIVMSATFIHPVFRKAIKRWIHKNNISSIHVHDLPLTGTALAIKKESNIPVIADFHENYPDALKVWFEWTRNPIARLKNQLFLNYNVWKKHERTAAKNADYVIAVVDEMKVRIIKEYNIAEEKIKVITNSEDKKFLSQPDDPSVYNGFENKFIITYTGNIGPHRGVDTIIEAMQHLKQYPEINFLIIGSGGNAIMQYLKERVSELGLRNTVHFLGRQPFSKFFSYMKHASVNVIPHKSNSHTDNTIPHKLFQGMMAGKPMLVSSSNPLKRIVDQNKVGLVFDAGNAEDAAGKILELYQDQEKSFQYGRNGFEVTVNGALNWDNDQKQLVHLYETLLTSKK